MRIITEQNLIDAIQKTINYFETMSCFDDESNKNVNKYSKEEIGVVKTAIEKFLMNLGYHPKMRNFPMYKNSQETNEG